MAKILLRFPVDAPAGRVHETLATNAGVSGWWSARTQGPGGVDSEMKVSFPDAPMSFDFRVAEDLPDKRVAWLCLAGPPEWIGTHISFDIEPQEREATSVLFTHDGWKTTQDSFPFIAYSWAQILPRLKALAETGEVDPYFKF
jgi:hypothetical protein